MLKIGIIGLGDIARKAYLPVISQRKAEVHLYTRNEDTLSEVSDLYRFKNIYDSVDALIDSGISGAFVHTATQSHQGIVEKLLSRNIHVYVDKPITYDYESSEKLVMMAEKRNLLLMVGFNRRYAPAYQRLKEMISPNMIIMQKNRPSQPGEVRTFIFDDFIHVIDTLLYFFPYPIEKIIVNGKRNENILYHVTVQLVAPGGATAIGVMNRNSGTTEERLEIFTASEKRIVNNMSEETIRGNKSETTLTMDDWTPMLYKRGFEQIIDDFLDSLKTGRLSVTAKPNVLNSHRLCEQVVQKLLDS